MTPEVNPCVSRAASPKREISGTKILRVVISLQLKMQPHHGALIVLLLLVLIGIFAHKITFHFAVAFTIAAIMAFMGGVEACDRMGYLKEDKSPNPANIYFIVAFATIFALVLTLTFFSFEALSPSYIKF